MEEGRARERGRERELDSTLGRGRRGEASKSPSRSGVRAGEQRHRIETGIQNASLDCANLEIADNLRAVKERVADRGGIQGAIKACLASGSKINRKKNEKEFLMAWLGGKPGLAKSSRPGCRC